jgi:hypothetical protein
MSENKGVQLRSAYKQKNKEAFSSLNGLKDKPKEKEQVKGQQTLPQNNKDNHGLEAHGNKTSLFSKVAELNRKYKQTEDETL